MSLTTDRIVSSSAMLVGFSSLVIALYQTHLMRESARASVLPYLMIAINSDSDGAYMTLRNAGLGPAVINDVVVSHQGRAIKGDAFDYYLTVRPGAKSDHALSVDKIMPGRLIPAGEGIRMIGMGGGERERMLSDLLHLFELAEVPQSWLENAKATEPDKAVLEISYSSVYGDHWIARSNAIVPKGF